MDYLFYSLGTTGDALPFIKLAASLNARGARSAFIGSEKFIPLAEAMNIEIFPVSSIAAYESTYNNPLTWSRNYSQNHYNEFHFPALKPTYKAVEKVVRQNNRPLIVYQDALSGARMAAEEFGLKSCQVVLAPYAVGSTLSPSYPILRQVEERLWGEILPQVKAKAKKDTFEGLVKPLINPARKELGLAQWGPDDLPDMESSPSIMALFPEWFKSNPGDWPSQLVNTGFILSDTGGKLNNPQLEEFINLYGRPLIFTFGTGIPVTSFLIDKIRYVCREVKKPGVFIAHSQKENLTENGDFPVLIQPTAPFSSLFARSALVIHHGGIGTCAQALACGAPQVISPYTFDQPDNAYLLWRLGISNAVDFLNDSVEKIADTIVEVMTSKSILKKVNHYQNLTIDATESSIDCLISQKN